MAITGRVLKAASGIRSTEAGLFLEQLDDLSTLLFADLRGLTSAELAWQLRPGTNTIGMLLAHLAITEVHWLLTATTGTGAEPIRRALGMSVEDDGIPLPARGRPPASLRGWTLADFRKLHRRARRFTRRALARMSPADLGRARVRLRWSGKREVMNTRWILHRVLVHQAHHHGQMMLLIHALRARKGASR